MSAADLNADSDATRSPDLRSALSDGTRYPGGKGGSGVYQKIIRMQPPHDSYIEPFLGKSAVMRNKKPAAISFGMDADKNVIAWWQRQQLQRKPIVGLQLWCGDALELFPNAIHLSACEPSKILIYADPEYLDSVTSRGRYAHRFGSEAQHRRLLRTLIELAGRGAMVQISGYYSPLYGAMLRGWYMSSYPAPVHRRKTAPREECLWCSFPPPQVLHDPRYAGENFRERTRIKRKVDRWRKKFAAMPSLERQAIREALDAVEHPYGQPGCSVTNDAADRNVSDDAAGSEEPCPRTAL